MVGLGLASTVLILLQAGLLAAALAGAARGIGIGALAGTLAWLGVVVAAASLAGADEFIRRLHRGYDTLLDEGGRTLSAGQRQKLALARAFLRRAPVLLLDEPTAHLDPASAGRVLTAIEGQMAGRTVILVTHRPPVWTGGSTRMLALDHGRLSFADDLAGRAGLVGAP
jgi:ABC-type multidrug transport system fused ATPase/permease subunit